MGRLSPVSITTRRIPAAPQRGDLLPGVGADLVGHGDQPADVALGSHEEDRAARPGQRLEPVAHALVLLPQLVEPAVRADPVALAVDDALDALAGNRPHVLGGGQAVPVARGGEHRLGNRVVGARLERRGAGEDLLLGVAVERDDLDHLGGPERQRAGLVERDRGQAGRVSMCSPPLTSTPWRAAAVSAATMLTGVEMTSAQGQAMTSRTSER